MPSWWWWPSPAVPPSEAPHVKALKNALLTLAMLTVHRDCICDKPTAGYAAMDGATLPNAAGCHLANACFTYMPDRGGLRADPWYTRVMEDKLDAIERFIARHIDTTEKAEELFEIFVASFCGSPSPSPPSPSPSPSPPF
jgi:hypothetical protein